AGLFVRTLRNLYNVDVGFNTRNLVLFTVNPTLNRYDTVRSDAVYAEMQERLGNVPGVRSVAYSNVMLLAGNVSQTSLFVKGRSSPLGYRDSTNRLAVSPGFFETMEMPVVAGAGFDARQTRTSPKVAILNETAARKLFPNGNPIGQHVGQTVETTGEIEI